MILETITTTVTCDVCGKSDRHNNDKYTTVIHMRSKGWLIPTSIGQRAFCPQHGDVAGALRLAEEDEMERARRERKGS